MMSSPEPAPQTPDICAICGSETMGGFEKGQSSNYGVFVACETAGCGRYIKQAADLSIPRPERPGGWCAVVRCVLGVFALLAPSRGA